MPSVVMNGSVDHAPPRGALLSRRSISAAWLSMIAPQGVWMMPLIVGNFASRLPMSNSAAGLLASTALLGACLMALMQAVLFRILKPRQTTLLCLGALGISYAGLALLPGYAVGLVLMGLMGLGMGGLLVVAMTTAVQTGRQTQVIALGGIGQGALSALLAWGVSTMGESRALVALPLMLLATSVAGLLAVGGVTAAPAPTVANEAQAEGAPSARHWPILLALAGWGLINFSNGGFWPMVERSAVADGLSVATISRAMSYTSVAGLIASFAVLLLARRLGLMLPIVLNGIGTGVAIMAIVWTPTPTSFALAMVLFGLLWSAGPAYQLTALAEADQTGNGMALAILVMKVTMAIGPVIYGVIADYATYFAAGIVSSVSAAISTVLFILSLSWSRRA